MTALILNNSAYLHRLGDLTVAQQAVVTELIEEASQRIERFCRRTFTLSDYDETVGVGEFGYAVLSGFPVRSLDRVFTGKGDLLTVRNSAATSASVSTTFGGLTLTSVTGGVTTARTIAYEMYPTLDALAAEITGSGWSATVASGYGGYPSSDIGAGQFVRCKDDSALWSWLDDDGGRYHVDHELGWLFAPCGYGVTTNRPHDPSSGGPELRVIYTAGYVTVPEPIQKICADLVVAAFDRSKGDGIQSETLGDYSVTYVTEAMTSLPTTAKQTLSMYRDRRP